MEEENVDLFEKVVNLTKRRGFIYPSSEIYGGFSGVYDYGPIGVLLANNIKNHWWKNMVQKRPDIVGLDSGIFMSPKVWEASGHVSGFSDPLMENKKNGNRVRADHILEEIGVVADEKMSIEEINELLQKNSVALKKTGFNIDEYSEAKYFNLLVKSNLGDFTEQNDNPTYLRGETCQGIYLNYKNVLDTTSQKIPYGIAQIGKAFRNEISARQFIFRTREFEQMEMQYFVRPEEEMVEYEALKEFRWKSLLSLGIKPENLQWHKHENLVFYAREAYDIEFKYPFGFKELEGIHARGNYDLTQHSTYSGQKLEYFDEEKKEHFLPHIIESSIGVGRLFLAILCQSYTEEQVGDDMRIVLRIPKHIAPIQIAILPLSKKDELSIPASSLFEELSDNFMCQYDETQSIGKRYRRQDEIGTPYCITYDFDSINDNMVTVRERDTMEQERVSISELVVYLQNKFKS
ncbi:glycine--tRNA ligase [Candidatus Nomurabacteria bacterium RIFCSPHIGHO2_02_FULL_33_12]|uniref:glycine--tRNA ligase n=1 Tax=Candidatus Nomurabacteria bacterium RIFCSPLOWO2_01_FULL_33_17 TaxID=1801764 RepID=A0A1F6WQW3_9BACT|nr:MAG: glycine--tRNA ligase [Candidatus Nomurabacteria bacterium RIFCSPHIGHO2_02_FULL_33_12]OGI84279.1 MAG: glycine--tRNA ligase [Candidatus Nomurabacteria bacterium RIFCSPLOWO2_01_FULL_33_17]